MPTAMNHSRQHYQDTMNSYLHERNESTATITLDRRMLLSMPRRISMALIWTLIRMNAIHWSAPSKILLVLSWYRQNISAIFLRMSSVITHPSKLLKLLEITIFFNQDMATKHRALAVHQVKFNPDICN